MSELLDAAFAIDPGSQAAFLGCLHGMGAGRFAVLIDGLDEMPDTLSFDDLLEGVYSLFCGNGGDRERLCLLATSRKPSSWPGFFSKLCDVGFAAYEICSISEMTIEARRGFVSSIARKWYECNGISGSEEKAMLVADAIEAGWSSRYSAMMQAPLNLVMLLSWFLNMETLPDSEHSLYEKYLRCKLRWRRGGSSADDLLLQLAYCSSCAAAGAGYEFPHSIDKGLFLEWLEESYSVLGTRLIDYRDRGFDSASSAAASVFGEMVQAHGVLIENAGCVEFEHRLLQAFLCEFALREGTCSPSFWTLSYAGLYLAKRDGGIYLSEDWCDVFRMLVQDPEIERSSLEELWEKVALHAGKFNPLFGDITLDVDEARVFAAVFLDGRIVASPSRYLDDLLKEFLSKTPVQFSAFLVNFEAIAMGPCCEVIVEALDRLRGSCPESRFFCMGAAVLDVLCALHSGRLVESGALADRQAEAIAERLEEKNRPVLDSLRHLEAMIVLKGRAYDFADAFLRGCSNGSCRYIETTLTAALSSEEPVVEVVHHLAEVSECKSIKVAVTKWFSMSNAKRLLSAIDAHLSAADEIVLDSCFVGDVFVLLSAIFETSERIDFEAFRRDYPSVYALIYQGGRAVMRWAASGFENGLYYAEKDLQALLDGRLPAYEWGESFAEYPSDCRGGIVRILRSGGRFATSSGKRAAALGESDGADARNMGMGAIDWPSWFATDAAERVAGRFSLLSTVDLNSLRYRAAVLTVANHAGLVDDEESLLLTRVGFAFLCFRRRGFGVDTHMPLAYMAEGANLGKTLNVFCDWDRFFESRDLARFDLEGRWDDDLGWI